MGLGLGLFFFFSSRRRHTRFSRDWSSDVCSSDLYAGFNERGFPVAALVDADPSKVGTHIGELVVCHVDDLPELVADHDIAIGIIATPASVAQEVADRLVTAGVTSVLNFAPALISVPGDVSLRKVDLAVELQIL